MVLNVGLGICCRRDPEPGINLFFHHCNGGSSSAGGADVVGYTLGVVRRPEGMSEGAWFGRIL